MSTECAAPLSVSLYCRIDREVDLVSPLVTPLTYEGLVDDIIGIDNGRIKLDAAVLGEQEDLSANLGAITGVNGQKVGE